MNTGKGKTQFSVNMVIVLTMLLVVVFGWGFLAGSYTGAHETKFSESLPDDPETQLPSAPELPDRARFFKNAIDQLPNFTSVVGWHLRNRVWLPLLVVGVFIAVIVGAVFMRRIDRELKQPYQVKYRKH